LIDWLIDWSWWQMAWAQWPCGVFSLHWNIQRGSSDEFYWKRFQQCGISVTFQMWLQQVNVNNAKIDKWCKICVCFKVEPHVKSEPPPKEPLKSGVVKVVQKTWNEIVMDRNKDVIILFTTSSERCTPLSPFSFFICPSYFPYWQSVQFVLAVRDSNRLSRNGPKNARNIQTSLLLKLMQWRMVHEQ
jgi:hypothetical protein